ncbi:MAG: aminopeptidase P family protein [Chloroflexi bacterium]|nr:aminopeptidase P family protein [Chloroflexota bacterium]
MNDNTLKLEKALRLVNQKGLDGLIVYSNGVRSMLRPGYLHYFAGLKPLGPNNAVIISKDGHVRLLVEPEWDVARASKKSWIRDVTGSSNFIKDLAGMIHEAKMEGSIGVAGSREMTEDLYLSIQKEVNVEPADDIIEELAREKTPDELDALRKTGKIADIGSQAFLEYARIGIREYEFSAEIEYAMRSAGADDNFILLSSEKHNTAMHNPRDKRLSEGDIILGEITPVCDGQFVQLCRTVVLGEPSPVLKRSYDMLVRALDESLKTIRAGVPASLMSKTMNKIIGEAGYAKYCYPPHMRARGHGIGVGSIAPGEVIDDDTQAILEASQAVIVHPNQYLPETGYLSCGETYLVTDTGIERLSETETKLYVKAV